MSVLNLLPVIITLFGLYMLVKLRFFFIVNPIRTAKRALSLFRDSSSRKALALALAGTLGVGNIVGVAYGLSVGGAGSLFWIFISSFFSAVIKYAESSLASYRRVESSGGMAYVIKASFKRGGRVLGAMYALLCIMLSLTMGSALQVKSFTDSLGGTVKIPEYVLSIFFVALVLSVILGGVKKISKVTSWAIPLSTLVYIILCLAVILKNIEKAPCVFANILSDAFNLKSIGGGVSSFIAMRALKEGYARGLLSNEAGAGTSAMAQSTSGGTPADAGLLGMIEVFFDTALLCMLTGFAVLFSGVDTLGLSGMEIVYNAFFAALGKSAVIIVFFLVFSFAFSTLICWYYYGTECVFFVFGKRRSPVYFAVFITLTATGFLIPINILISASDYLLFFMSVITVATLYKNSESIVLLSERCGLLKNSNGGKKLKSKI